MARLTPTPPAATGDLDVRRPFTRADAIAAGITPKMLAGSRFRRVFRGVYVASNQRDSPALRAAAALAPFGPDAFVSHLTAARLYEAPVPPGADEHVTVPAPPGRRRRTPFAGVGGIVCHLDSTAAGLPPAWWRGVRVSAPARMFTELSGVLDLVDLVVVGDNLVRRRLTTIPELHQAADQTPGPTGSRARTAAHLVRDRVDSPMETRTRLLLVFAGLPEPELNRVVRDADGTPLRRYDLCWPEARVVVEYDGRHHAEREDQWESDLDRREAVDDSGWRILVLTSRDIWNRPEQTVRRVWAVLRDRGHPGVPPRPRADWRPHFPPREPGGR